MRNISANRRALGNRGRFLALVALLATVSGWRAVRAAGQNDLAALPPPSQTKVDFARDIEPLLGDRCQTCHGPNRQMGDLRLDNRADALKGGESGPVIKPGDSAGSKLIQLVAGIKKDSVMPIGLQRLTPEQVGLFRAWIDQGAEWPEPQTPATQPAKAKKSKDPKTH